MRRAEYWVGVWSQKETGCGQAASVPIPPSLPFPHSLHSLTDSPITCTHPPTHPPTHPHPPYHQAVAKYYGTYAALEKGFVQHALTLITGAKTECLYLADASNGTGKSLLWRNLLQAHENKYILGAASITGDTTHKEILESGIMMNAAYLIYEVVQVDKYQLIKLRNPPDYGEGSGEWSGDWSDRSPLWTKRLRKKLKHVEDAKDSQFWMSFDDFCIVFRSVYVCRAINHEHWKKTHLQGFWKAADGTAAGLPSPLNPECDIAKLPQYSVFVHRPTDVCITLSQTENGYATLQDPPFHVALYLLQSTEGGKLTKDSKQAQARVMRRISNVALVAHSGDPAGLHEVTVTAHLQPGYYAVVCALFQRGFEGPYELDVKTRHAVVVERIDPALKTWRELRVGELKAARQKVDKELDKIAHVTGEAEMQFVGFDHKKNDAQASGGDADGPPFHWVALKDEASGRDYYFNLETQASSWEPPSEWTEDKGRMRKVQWEKEKAEKKKAKRQAKADARKQGGSQPAAAAAAAAEGGGGVEDVEEV